MLLKWILVIWIFNKTLQTIKILLNWMMNLENEHDIEENKNELNEQCEHEALVSSGNVISVSL